MKVLSPFGPKIAIIKIPKNIVNKINQEVDEILGDKKKLKKSDYSKKLVGQVKQEIKLDNKFVKNNILKFITTNIKTDCDTFSTVHSSAAMSGGIRRLLPPQLRVI